MLINKKTPTLHPLSIKERRELHRSLNKLLKIELVKALTYPVIMIAITFLLCVAAYPVAAETTCATDPAPQDRTLEYFGCLQSELIEAQLKANIKGEKNKNDQTPLNITPHGNGTGPDLFKAIEIPSTEATKPTIAYVGYSSSNLGTEAIISYGNTKTRARVGSSLRGGQKVQHITPDMLTLSGNGKTSVIPLTTVRDDN